MKLKFHNERVVGANVFKGKWSFDVGKLVVLLIDDDAFDRKLLKRHILESGLVCDFIEADSMSDFLLLHEVVNPDFAFVDFRLADCDGIDLIPHLLDRWPSIAIAMVTGQGDEEVAVSAIKAGAFDYIPKHLLNKSSARRVIEKNLDLARLIYELKEKRSEMERFGRVLAHDFSAPVRGVRILCELLSDNLSRKEYDQADEVINKIFEQVRRMSSLLKGLREYNFLERGPNVMPVDLNEVMSETVGILSAEIATQAAVVTFDELPVVSGNKALLMQLYQNLLGNSLKYCSEERPDIYVQAEKAVDGWVVSLIDNGIGIKEEDAIRIFKPFERVHLGSNFSGSGLGLATCKRIAEYHHAEIWAEPRPNAKGTVFKIRFPNEISS